MTKRLISLVLVTALQIGMVTGHAYGQAAQKIVVLDLLAVRVNSLAGKSISEQFRAYRKAFQKEAEAQQKKLRAARNELRLQRSLLSPEALQAREKKFNDQVALVQRQFQDRKKSLEKSRVEALKVFDSNLTEVLKVLRRERKFDIIINKRPAVIYAHSQVDITAEVLKRLDGRIKKVTVEKPGK